MNMISRFFNQQQKLFSYHHQGDAQACYQMLDQMEKEFPLMHDKLAIWRASMLLSEGKKQEAIRTMEQAFEKGIYLDPMIFQLDEEFKALEHIDSYERLLEQINESLSRERNSSKPLLIEKGNPAADTGIYGLHMRFSNAEVFSEAFLTPETIDRFAFGFLQSSQMMGSHAFVWDDDTQAMADIETTLHAFKRKHSFEHLLVTGGSQGGRLAIETALRYPNVKGFIAVIPYIQDTSAIEQLAKEYSHHTKGVIIAGESEASYEKTLRLIEIFKENNITHRFLSIKGMGHTLPKDFTRYFTDAVDYILE
ncbi:hypothetical protein [Pradoshia sp.]